MLFLAFTTVFFIYILSACVSESPPTSSSHLYCTEDLLELIGDDKDTVFNELALSDIDLDSSFTTNDPSLFKLAFTVNNVGHDFQTILCFNRIDNTFYGFLHHLFYMEVPDQEASDYEEATAFLVDTFGEPDELMTYCLLNKPDKAVLDIDAILNSLIDKYGDPEATASGIRLLNTDFNETFRNVFTYDRSELWRINGGDDVQDIDVTMKV